MRSRVELPIASVSNAPGSGSIIVADKGQIDFDYWLNTYRYARAMAYAACVRGLLHESMAAIDSSKDDVDRKAVVGAALAQRIELARAWEKMMWCLESTVSTPWELGTIANIEQHTRVQDRFIDQFDKKLVELLGARLGPEAAPCVDYRGESRIIVPTVRSLMKPGEHLAIQVIVLSPAKSVMPSVYIYWRPLGQGVYCRLTLNHVGRSVYDVTLPVLPAKVVAIEYFVRAGSLVFPATAPELNQTIVISH